MGNAQLSAKSSTGVLPLALRLPECDKIQKGTTSSSLLERRGGMGGQALSPSFISHTLIFYIVIEEILQNSCSRDF